MLKFLKKKLYDEKGAMDKILVTLLLIIIAVAGIFGLSTWSVNNQERIERQAVAEIDKILEEEVPAAGGNQGNHFGQFKNDEEDDLILED